MIYILNYLCLGLITYLILIVFRYEDIKEEYDKEGFKPVILGFILTLLLWYVAIFRNIVLMINKYRSK